MTGNVIETHEEKGEFTQP